MPVKKKFQSARNLPSYRAIGLRRFFTRPISVVDSEFICRVLYLCARYRVRDQELLLTLTRELEKRAVDGVSSKWLGRIFHILTAFDSNHWHPLRLYFVDELITQLDRNVFDNPYSLSRLCCVLSKSGIDWPDKLTGPVHRYVERNMQNFTVDELTTVVHSLEKVKQCDPSLLDSAARYIAGAIEECTQANHIHLLSTFGSAMHFCEPYYNALAEHVVSGRLAKPFTPRFLNAVGRSCVQLNFYHDQLMRCLHDELLSILPTLDVSTLCTTSQKFSHFNHNAKDIVLAVADELSARDKSTVCREPYLCLAVWACTVVDVYPLSLINLFLANFRSQMDKHRLKEFRYAPSLMQLDIALTVEHPELKIPSLSLLEKAVCMDALLRRHAHMEVGKTHKHVLDILARIFGQKHASFRTNAHTTSGYSIDIEVLLDKDNRLIVPPLTKSSQRQTLVEFLRKLEVTESQHCSRLSTKRLSKLCPLLVAMARTDESFPNHIRLACDWWSESQAVARRVAIEVDGPSHYVINGRRPVGKTVLKKRQLEALGWEVIQIPYFDWGSLGKGRNMKYLYGKLFPD